MSAASEVVPDSVNLWDVLEDEATGQLERVLSDIEASAAGSIRRLAGLGVEYRGGESRQALARDAVSIVAGVVFSAACGFLDDGDVSQAFARGLARVGVSQ